MNDRDNLPPLSEAQLEIMDVVWERDEATLAQVWTKLSQQREIAKNTVQTQLTRLLEKGWLSSRAEGKTFLYRATVPRKEARSGVVQRVLESAFGGSTEGLVMALLDGRRLSKEEADRIRKLIDEAEKEGR